MAATRKNLWLVIVLCCGAGASFAMAFVVARRDQPVTKRAHTEPESLPPLPIAEAKQTTVVPTLDTPLPEGKSAIWCASFQLAWDRLKADITHGPVQLRNAETVAEQLNRAGVSDTDLRPEDYFAIAGKASDGVAGTIQREMTRRFPDAPRPELEVPPDGLAAFAFLAAAVPWRYEFHDNPKPLEFTDAAGRRTPVRSFGILETDEWRDPNAEFFRGQVALLWTSRAERTRDEFAVDLCRHSTPYQVVLARVERKSTLADTLNDVQLRAQREPARNDRLSPENTLLVPTMHWRIEQHFKELEGRDKVLANGPQPGLFLDPAVQEIQFRLDRRGAEVASGGYMVFNNGGPSRLHFDRPFLLYVKKRDGKQPFLVMWVENPGLLQPF